MNKVPTTRDETVARNTIFKEERDYNALHGNYVSEALITPIDAGDYNSLTDGDVTARKTTRRK